MAEAEAAPATALLSVDEITTLEQLISRAHANKQLRVFDDDGNAINVSDTDFITSKHGSYCKIIVAVAVAVAAQAPVAAAAAAAPTHTLRKSAKAFEPKAVGWDDGDVAAAAPAAPAPTHPPRKSAKAFERKAVGWDDGDAAAPDFIPDQSVGPMRNVPHRDDHRDQPRRNDRDRRDQHRNDDRDRRDPRRDDRDHREPRRDDNRDQPRRDQSGRCRFGPKCTNRSCPYDH